MACKSNCAGCSDTLVGNTQKSMVANIQPCSAGYQNDIYSAMTDGDWPAVKVTGKSRQWRGARTPQWRRNSDGTNQICHVTEAVPGDNTITLEFADCGCGGYSPDEIAEQGSFDLYEMQRCCGLVDVDKGWSRIKVTRCISFSGVDESPSTSYDSGEDGELTRTYTGGLFSNAYTVYPLTFGEIAADAGFDTGARMRSPIYANPQYGCSADCEDSCTDRWYSVTNEGNVIYRLGKNYAISNSLIPAFVASIATFVGFAGNRMIVPTALGYWTSELDEKGAPTTWTFYGVTINGNNFTPNGVLQYDANTLYIFGTLSATNGAVYKVDSDGVVTVLYTNTNANTVVIGMDRCNDNVILARNDGVVMHAIGQCTSFVATTTAPTANPIRGVGFQPGGTYWAVADTTVYVSRDQGDTWQTVSLPGTTPAALRRVVWQDAGVGYIMSTTELYATINGGRTWTIEQTGSRIGSAPRDVFSFMEIAVPCCKSSTQSANSVLISGIATGNTGALWVGGIRTC